MRAVLNNILLRFKQIVSKGLTYASIYKGGLAIVGSAVVLMPIFLIGISHAVIHSYSRYVLDSKDSNAVVKTGATVGIVLGAGITRDGKPFRELQSRLDTAAAALESGAVDKLVLSGDNRFAHYNEPAAMKKYLVQEKQIPADKLQEDYAGRSTYESCERAAKVFELDKVVLISAGSHLPRAIYLCRQFGVEAYGIASSAEANNHKRREAMARVKAIFNVYVNGENTILSAPMRL